MRGWVFLIMVVMAAPSAAASAATISLRDATSIEFDSAFAAVLPAGSGRVLGDEATGPFELRGVTGTIRVWSGERENVYVAGGGLARDSEPTQDRTFDLENATLRLEVVRERVAIRVAMNDTARVIVSGPAEDVGLPSWLAREIEQEAGASNEAEVDWTWRAGWPFIGSYESTTPIVGFPHLRDAIASLEGEGAVQLSGGNLSFTDAHGQSHRLRLGNWSVSLGEVGIDSVKIRKQAVGVAVIRGTIGSANLPLQDQWGFAAPSMDWESAGLVHWRGATGSAEIDGQRTDFVDASVRLRGSIATQFDPNGAMPTISRARYSTAGSVDVLTIDGRAITTPARSVNAGVAVGLTIGGILLLAAYAWLYTRIDRASALDHPTRARIRTIVEKTPGIHLRALHRLVGGAWGPFSFHVRLLSRMGLVIAERDGRFQALHAPGSRKGGPLVRGTQALVLDAFLAGERRSVPEIATELGLSPRLVRYHLAALRRRGLLEKKVEA